jgi:hypothetical protein
MLARFAGQTVINVFNLVATITSISLVGGWPFACALCVLGGQSASSALCCSSCVFRLISYVHFPSSLL